MASSVPLPPPNEQIEFADSRALAEWMRQWLVDPADVEGEVSLSVGAVPPANIDTRGAHVHFGKDSNGCIRNIQVFCRDRWVILYSQVHGEIRWFPQGNAPKGWVVCDGNNGSPDLQSSPMFSLGGTTKLHYFSLELT